jgi:hypothetical protein
MTEKELELMLVKEVKRRGGRAYKFISPGINGVPDRLVLLPYGRAGFVEVKAPGKKMRPRSISEKVSISMLITCMAYHRLSLPRVRLKNHHLLLFQSHLLPCCVRQGILRP